MPNMILLALAPIFFVLALGYGAGRLRIVDNSYRLDSAAAGSMVIASTVLSIVTTAIAISVLFPN